MLENEREIECASCGKVFLLRQGEYEQLTLWKKRPLSYCKFCRKEYNEKMCANSGIESLKIQTQDRPLKNLIRNQRVLCFNYTEFVENLYDVDSDTICYIHG